MRSGEKQHETKAKYEGKRKTAKYVGKNGMKQKPYEGNNSIKQRPDMKVREKWHETKAKYVGKNGMKQKPNVQGKTALYKNHMKGKGKTA